MENVIVLFVFLCCTRLTVQAANLTVSIYYESLCPDSIDFLKDQFYPAYSTVLKEKIIVDLVPFGKATAKKENGKWSFDCQHGEKECFGNKVHGCAIDVTSNEISTEFIVCTMKSGDASDANNLKQCAQDTNVTWSKIQQCLTSGRGDEILAKNGDRTHAVKPKITFIPTVLLNNFYNEKLEKLILKDFRETIEFMLEDENCLNHSSSSSTRGFSLVLILLSLISILKM